ncbi:hypothetical protein HW115_18570 [Verrucomicrobiaceae bacterium N1E253]|uniref:Uncharacterized protein n=1 Tax=Oceaniferula marina TaxID=2748318 RepID=A0A851GIK2_9BACT|nr:hypothetical protein [Oceaniferula marina]NWK57628.1 hypothetical protein [Oceaniferula marina]
MSTTSLEEVKAGAKIIASSLLSGFSILGFILSLIFNQENIAVFSLFLSLFFLYALTCSWFSVRPIQSILNWIAGYDSLENRIASDEGTDSQGIKN